MSRASLAHALGARDPWIRCAAILVLGCERQDIEELLEVLEGEASASDPMVLAGAAYVLSRLGSCPDGAREALREVYQGVLGSYVEFDLRICERLASARAERARSAARKVREALAEAAGVKRAA